MKKTVSMLLAIAVIFTFSFLAIASGSEKAEEASGGESSENENSNSGKAEYKLGKSYSKIEKDSIGSVYITVAYEVINSGKVAVFLKDGTADIENKDGSLIDTVENITACPQILKPGETGWYFERTLFDGKTVNDIKSVPHPNVEKSSDECIRFNVSDTKLNEEQYLGVKTIGRIENQTKSDYDSVIVSVNMFDSNGKVINKEYTYIDEGIKAGEKKSFEISSLNTKLKASDVSKYEVYAYPSQYNF